MPAFAYGLGGYQVVGLNTQLLDNFGNPNATAAAEPVKRLWADDMAGLRR